MPTGAELGSPGSGPAITSKSRSTSRTVRAIGPTTPRYANGPAEPGKCPVDGILPGVGFSPQIPVKCAGIRIDPPPSLPTPPAEHPAAIAADSPPLDPPAVRVRSQGLFTRPYIELSLSYAIRNSGTFVFPRMIAPAPRNRATSGASVSGVLPFRSTLPHSHGSPATSIELFTVTGTPCSDPRAFFPPGAAAAASAAFALPRARSASTFANAFNFGFNRSIRPRCASSNSTGEISPARTRSAIPISDPYTISSTWPPRIPQKALKRAAVYHAAITGYRLI